MAEDLPKIISDEEFADLLKEREKSDRLSGAEAWDTSSVAPPKKATDGRPESTLEQKFPRVAEKLTLVWPSEACSSFINSLVVNPADRDTRQGFPQEVIEDLLMLHAINEMLMRKIGAGSQPRRPYPEANSDLGKKY